MCLPLVAHPPFSLVLIIFEIPGNQGYLFWVVSRKFLMDLESQYSRGGTSTHLSTKLASSEDREGMEG